ncbi:uncharacterized protein LOC118201621 [Stegodyphus dumicola]|uniref:uncharacterized protein LOC118201621 n=1 Tax=Stegodyphus dumicola TaxID=202533 RepID=UPI0015AA479F|nr:uncharacterized protein LOC118201621 [Stegodyphus dumicola]
MLDIFQNQALRLIIGGVKTTAVLAMHLLCNLQPMTNLVQRNVAIFYNRLTRLPNISFWREYDCNRVHNLITLKSFIQCIQGNAQYNVINDKAYEFLTRINPLEFMVLHVRLDLTLNVRKNDLCSTALHAIALETINTCYPPVEWLHIYTDGSLLDFTQGAITGIFCDLFSFYQYVGSHTTHFDGEVEAIS